MYIIVIISFIGSSMNGSLTASPNISVQLMPKNVPNARPHTIVESPHMAITFARLRTPPLGRTIFE